VPFGPEGLVVTWVGPVPRFARVTLGDGEIFRSLEEVTGGDVPEGFPKEYVHNLQEAKAFNSSILWDTAEVVAWQKRYGIEMEPGPLQVFEYYLKTGSAIFATLVEHPLVPNADRFTACDVLLQRAAIVLGDGREDLFLRSYFRSATEDGESVNFVPMGGVHYSFASDSLWYPLELSRFISQPASYLELDILTRGPLDEAAPIPKHIQAIRRGEMTHLGIKHYVTRLSAKLEVEDQRFRDLRIRL
jgi:hypothetical protein